MRARLDVLREDFAEESLLGKVFGADDDVVVAIRAAGSETANADCRYQRDEPGSRHHARTGRNRRSTKLSRKSAPRARRAAGIAPARISWLLTIAKPRKINSPKPPAPMAAAIVAMPMVRTVATRMPARM